MIYTTVSLHNYKGYNITFHSSDRIIQSQRPSFGLIRHTHTKVDSLNVTQKHGHTIKHQKAQFERARASSNDGGKQKYLILKLI